MNEEQKQLHDQMRKKISATALRIIVEMFERTEAMPADPEMILLRGLLMDEMEKRNPVAFAEWLECQTPSLAAKPSNFFLKE